MGGIGSSNGITLEFFKQDGSPDAAKPSIDFKCCWLTAQGRGLSNVGSQDWLKEVYLAPDSHSLYQLMRKYPPKGTVPPLTTAASLNVTVYYIDKTVQQPPHKYKSAIGLGIDKAITGPTGKAEKVRVFHTLKVCDGDASKPGNLLYEAFKKAIPFFVVTKR